MRNVIIGLTIVFLLIAGFWYFLGSSSQMDSVNEIGHKNMSEMGNMDLDSGMEFVICPVMGTKMDPAKAYGKTEYKGKTYYFCCAACPELFKKDPEKYIKKYEESQVK